MKGHSHHGHHPIAPANGGMAVEQPSNDPRTVRIEHHEAGMMGHFEVVR